MNWLVYLGIPILAIVLGAWLLSKMLRKRQDDDDGDDYDLPESEVPAPLSPRPKTKSASAVIDPPEVDKDEEL